MNHPWSDRLERAALVGAALGAAVLPLAALVAGNSDTHNFSVAAVVRPLVVLAAGALLTCVVFWVVLRRPTQALVAGCVFWVAVDLLPVVMPVWQAAEGVRLALLVVVSAVSIGVGRFLRRPGTAVLATVILLSLAGTAAQVGWKSWEGVPRAWRPATVALTEQAAEWTPHTASRPDLYYIVFDAFASPETLSSRFGLDVAPALRRIDEAGGSVAYRARSNYSQTHLSLASSLNMGYLDAIASVMGGSRDRRPLLRAIQESGVIRRLRDLGYEFLYVGADASIARQHEQADRCVCPLPAAPSELEYALLTNIGLRVPAIDQWALGGHRSHVLASLAAINDARSDRPLLVVAHVLAPHPPFVFGAGGGQARLFSFYDGDLYAGTRDEYVRGYRDQAGFMLGQVERLFAGIGRRGRPAVVVVHADHGSGLTLDNNDATRTDPKERFGIFFAAFVTGGTPDLPSDISPVNAWRWMLNTALDARIPLLPSRSAISSYEHPYAFAARQVE